MKEGFTMKRSEINGIIQHTMDVMEEAKFPLPPFAYYTPEDWRNLDESERELSDNMLGWDISDFGGNFKEVGLTIFTFRNGNFHDKKTYPKPYCEKLDFVTDGQVLPFHYHWSKMEDIINRGGGDLAVTLYNSDPADFADHDGAARGIKGRFLDTPVSTSVDGKKMTIPAGGKIILKPGQSILITPGIYHSWQGVPGTGDVILFEVSTTNDDKIDNRFAEAASRIPEIEEDVEPNYLIFADYPKYTRF